MTPEQFWNGDPWLAKAFKEKHKLECKQKNEEMWLNGMYQLSALNVALNNAFSKHKIDYVKEPFDIFPKTQEEEEAEKEKERKKLVERLKNWTV